MGFKSVVKVFVIVAIIGFSFMTSQSAISSVRNSLIPVCDDDMFEIPVQSREDGVERRDVVAATEVPKFQVSSLYRKEHARIDDETAEARCDRYDLKPYDGHPRRIFFGTMIADDHWETMLIHAIEVYDIYHVAVFVESNTTHMATPRKLRFKDSLEGDLLVRSEMFGPNTNVYLDLWLEARPDLKAMDRESEQRNTIIKRWKDAGMMPSDVGIMSDTDEVVSRDFLRAVQTCDFPELRPDPSCHSPKIIPSTISFESSPYCIKRLPWYHPDIIGGRCVDGIGDPTERVTPLRTHKRMYGERHKLYGKTSNMDYPDAVHKSGRYPLFNGPDIRTVPADRGFLYKSKDMTGDRAAIRGAAYHLHNWFADLKVIRNKYRTYAHGNDGVERLPLSEITDDLDITVRCAKGIFDKVDDISRSFYPLGRANKGPRPIFFLNKTYSQERHKLLQKMVRQDEQTYGASYDSKRTSIDKSLPKKKQRKQAVTDSLGGVRADATTGEASRNGIEKKKSEFAISAVKYPDTPFRDSSTATVMGMATGFSRNTMSQFVNSLRNTGYRGHIILGVKADVDKSLLAYMARKGVIAKLINFSNCTYEPFYKPKDKNDAASDGKALVPELSMCAEPYLDVKGRWAKFPMGRDWLKDCSTCTGPVLISDVRDVFFQHDPFGPGTPEVTGLQVYEEHPSTTTEHWLVDWPVGECKGVHLNKPMLCSGTTIGTRDAMMTYLDAMYDEMKRWISDPKCRFRTEGDDQSIHNWLFYNGDLKDAVAVKHREGVVNTVGVEGSNIFRANEKQSKEKGVKNPLKEPFPGASSRTWISSQEFGLTNEDGEFTNLDGTISPVVHQYDRFGPTLKWFLARSGLFVDDSANQREDGTNAYDSAS
ncbi:hypothetical protein MHU86_11787 [Fragilaria crotonensis]|nr:hypothetical protein MHU86_11787 [Fragilaria crotonensis]